MPKEESEETKGEDTEEEISEQEKDAEEREESELEEGIEDVGIQSMDFSQFIQPSIESSAPVLERITRAPELQDVVISEESFSPVSTKTEDRTRPDYVITNEPDQVDANILKYETATIGPPVLKPVGFSREVPKQELLDPVAGRGMETFNTEFQKIDSRLIEENKRLPFEVEEKKYKEFKPRRFE